MKRRILKAVGYSFFFLFAVLLFMYWTFPMDKVRDWVEQEAFERFQLDLSIAELDLAGLNGVEAEDVVLRMRAAESEDEPAAGAAEGEAGDRAERQKWRTIRISRLEAHVGLWDVLFNDRIDIRADLEALGGRIEGLRAQNDKEAKRWLVEAETIEDVSLGPLPLEDWIGVDLKGTLAGSLSADLGRNILVSTATADLELQDVKLPSPEIDATLYGQVQTFVLSDVDVGSVKLQLALDKKGNIPALGAKSGDRSTVLHFATLQVSGGDLELGLDERSFLTLNPGGLKSTFMNVHGSFHVKDAFIDRQVRKDGEVEKPNLFVRTFLGDRKWRAAERGGLYGFRCVGPLAAKSCSPAAPPGRGRYTPSARKKAVGRDADRGRVEDEPAPRDDDRGVDESATEPFDRSDREAARRIRMIGDRDPDRGRPGFIRDRRPPRPTPTRTRTRDPRDDPDERKTIPIELPDHPQPGDLVEPEDELIDEPLDGEPIEDDLVPLDEIPVDEDGVPLDEDGVPLDEDGVPLDEDGVPLDEDGVPLDEEGAPVDDLPPPDDYQPY